MPKLGATITEKLWLPSTKDEANELDRAYVLIKKTLLLGDLAAITEATDDVERSIVLLERLISDWNFTVDGTPETAKLDIVKGNIEKLATEDFIFLSQWVSENLSDVTNGLTNDEKKSSSSISIPVTETPQTIT